MSPVKYYCPHCGNDSVDFYIDKRGYKMYRCIEYDCRFYKECSGDRDLIDIEEICELLDEENK